MAKTKIFSYKEHGYPYTDTKPPKQERFPQKFYTPLTISKGVNNRSRASILIGKYR